LLGKKWTVLGIVSSGKDPLIIGKKYALIVWRKLCLHKELGGIDILDLNLLNLSLLLK
jgi:hypothetical protein